MCANQDLHQVDLFHACKLYAWKCVHGSYRKSSLVKPSRKTPMIAKTYLVLVSTTASSNRKRTQLALAFVAACRFASKKKCQDGGGKRRETGTAKTKQTSAPPCHVAFELHLPTMYQDVCGTDYSEWIWHKMRSAEKREKNKKMTIQPNTTSIKNNVNCCEWATRVCRCDRSGDTTAALVLVLNLARCVLHTHIGLLYTYSYTHQVRVLVAHFHSWQRI